MSMRDGGPMINVESDNHTIKGSSNRGCLIFASVLALIFGLSTIGLAIAFPFALEHARSSSSSSAPVPPSPPALPDWEAPVDPEDDGFIHDSDTTDPYPPVPDGQDDWIDYADGDSTMPMAHREATATPLPRSGGGDIITFIVDSDITAQGVQVVGGIEMGLPTTAPTGAWTHGDMVAYSFRRFSGAPMVGYGLLSQRTGNIWNNYLDSLRWIRDYMRSHPQHTKCIINHSWGQAYGTRNVFSPTTEQDLMNELEGLGCIQVSAAANWKQFEICEAKIDPANQAAWTGVEDAGLVDRWVVEDFPQFHSRGTGFIIGMYNQFANAFPSRPWSSEATVGFGPCTLHAPGVHEPVGPNANNVNTGSSFASPITAAFLNCYWSRNPTLTPAQAVSGFQTTCFRDQVLADTPFPGFDFEFDGMGNIDATPRTPTRPTQVLDMENAACTC